MKKIFVAVAIFCAVITFSACKENDIDKDEKTVENTDQKDNTNQSDKTNQEEAVQIEKATLDDYFPFKKDTISIFEGEGNEYAGFQMVIDFIDEGKNRMQTRTNNGGTEEVRVIEKQNGEVRVILSRPECYYRDNLMDQEGEQGEKEILLKEPLEVGTEWTLPDGRRRFISGVNVEVSTPMGIYQTIQVNTQVDGESEYTIKEYYAKEIGLVKRVYESEGMVVTSSIKEIKENTAYSQMIDLYYVDIDEKVNTETVTLTFHTNDITREVIQDAVIKTVEEKKDTLPIMSINTKIYSMYLGDDGIAYIDLSKEFITDMNVGSGYESAILQAIVNTVGRYYGVQEVFLTVEQKPYESGHLLFKKGQTMKCEK
ncbi:MAG: GerMN domain-containing protein [Lachnospiraceae bacterium]|nr:GerMN domain-containing protein [Lachnospiraceae bacterium]